MDTQETANPLAADVTFGSGQLNLFTGELEPSKSNDTHAARLQGWLFDPDWNLVIPDDPAGRGITVDQGPCKHKTDSSLPADVLGGAYRVPALPTHPYDCPARGGHR